MDWKRRSESEDLPTIIPKKSTLNPQAPEWIPSEHSLTDHTKNSRKDWPQGLPMITYPIEQNNYYLYTNFNKTVVWKVIPSHYINNQLFIPQRCYPFVPLLY